MSQTALRFGEALTLTAAVSGASSGTLAFYNGVNVIAVEPVASGIAIAKTSGLVAGPQGGVLTTV